MKRILVLSGKLSLFFLWLGIVGSTCAYGSPVSDTTATLQSDSTAYLNEMELIMGLARKHAKSDPQTSYAHAQKALRKAIQSGDTLHQAFALYFIGNYFYVSGKFTQALLSYQQMLELHKLKNNQNEIAYALLVMGNIYLDMNKNAEALDHYIQALQLFEASGKTEASSSVYSNIGSVYLQENNYVKAREYYKKAMDLVEGPDKLERKAVYINNIGRTYFLEKDYDKAFTCYKEALTIKEALEDTYGMIVPLKNMATIYAVRKNYPEASRLLTKALSLARKHHYQSYEILILSEMAAEVYMPQKNYEQAKIYAMQAVQLAEQNQDIKRLQSLYKSLPEIFTSLGQPALAANYARKHAHLTDSLSGAFQNDKIKQLEKELDTTKKETSRPPALDMLTGIPARNNSNLGTTLLFLALGVFSVSVLIFNRTQKKHSGSVSPSGNVPEQKLAATLLPVPADEPAASSASPKVDYIQVVHQEGELPLSLDKILWFEKEERQYYACTAEKKYRTRHTISALEELLANENFFRINRAVLINLDYLHNYSHWEYDKYIIRMKNPEKTQFIMSRDRLKILNKKLNL